MAKAKSAYHGDLLADLGEKCTIRYVTPGSGERQFQVIGGPRFVRRIVDEFLQDAMMVALDVVFPGGRRVRLKGQIAGPGPTG